MRSETTIRDLRVAGSDYLLCYMPQIVGVNSEESVRHTGPITEHSSSLSPPGISVFRKANKVFTMAESKNLVT